MTLARTALRMLTVHALRGATNAGARVYDSRVDDLSPDVFADDAKPVLVVLTDEDKGDQLSDQDGGPPFVRMIELVLQIGMLQRLGEDADSGEDANELIYPETDAELEAALDVVEFQIMRRLGSEVNVDILTFWRKISRIVKYECHRQIVDEAGQRLAVRVLTLTCNTHDDEVPVYNIDADDYVAPGGLDKLPEPLRSVAALLPATSASRAICNMIADQIVPLEAPNFEAMETQVDASLDDEGGSDMVDVDIEIHSAASIYQNVANSNAIEIDYARGTSQMLLLNANLDTITFKNWPKAGKTGRLILYVTQMGSFTIAENSWKPANLFVNGLDYVPSVGAGKRDVLSIIAGDGGLEFYIAVVGQNWTA